MISENENSIIFDCFVLFSFFLFLYNESQRNPKQYWTLGCTILKKKTNKKTLHWEIFIVFFFLRYEKIWELLSDYLQGVNCLEERFCQGVHLHRKKQLKNNAQGFLGRGRGGCPFRTAGFGKTWKTCLFLGCTVYKNRLKSLSVTVLLSFHRPHSHCFDQFSMTIKY